MESKLKTRLLEALKLTAPEIGKDYLYERCVAKYISAMLPAISAAIALHHKGNGLMSDQFYFSQSKVREEIGTIGKQQQYIYQLMKGDKSTSLLLVKSKG